MLKRLLFPRKKSAARGDDTFFVVYREDDGWKFVLREFTSQLEAYEVARRYVSNGIRSRVMTGQDIALGRPLD